MYLSVSVPWFVLPGSKREEHGFLKLHAFVASATNLDIRLCITSILVTADQYFLHVQGDIDTRVGSLVMQVSVKAVINGKNWCIEHPFHTRCGCMELVRSSKTCFLGNPFLAFPTSLPSSVLDLAVHCEIGPE